MKVKEFLRRTFLRGRVVEVQYLHWTSRDRYTHFVRYGRGCSYGWDSGGSSSPTAVWRKKHTLKAVAQKKKIKFTVSENNEVGYLLTPRWVYVLLFIGFVAAVFKIEEYLWLPFKGLTTKEVWTVYPIRATISALLFITPFVIFFRALIKSNGGLPDSYYNYHF